MSYLEICFSAPSKGSSFVTNVYDHLHHMFSIEETKKSQLAYVSCDVHVEYPVCESLKSLNLLMGRI